LVKNRKPLHQRKPSKKSLSNNWWTPKDLYYSLCKQYKINPRLDVAATPVNTKCSYYITKKQNSLKRDWVLKNNHKVPVWCNPPNKDLQKFIRKAYQQWIKFKKDFTIMMIVPGNVGSSAAWWDCVEDPIDNGENIFHRFIKKRINFLDRGKKPKSSARNAYMVVIWRHK